MKEFVFLANEQFNNVKVLEFLKKHGVSDEIIRKIKFGGIFLNETILKNVNNVVNAGDVIKIVLPLDEPNPYVTPVKGDLCVVYEDAYLLAVNKPKGMLTHTSKSNQTIALDRLVCGYFSPNPFVFRAINRLDKDTSGIVLIAKDALTASLLGEQMKEGKIIKTYSALVVGVPNDDHFIIEKPIKRQSSSSIKRECASDGKYAKSECNIIKKLENGNSIIDVRLITGRTHQIRVHLSSIGFPLYADSLYGEGVEGETYTLCAKRLQFIHPVTKKELIIELSENLY